MKTSMIKKAILVMGLGLGLSATVSASTWCEFASEQAFRACGIDSNSADCQFWAEQSFLCGPL